MTTNNLEKLTEKEFDLLKIMRDLCYDMETKRISNYKFYNIFNEYYYQLENKNKDVSLFQDWIKS